MSIRAQNTAAVGIVEQYELFRQTMLIWSDIAAENTEVFVSIAAFDITEDLIVSAVFLDDVDDVFDQARFADAFGNCFRRLIGPRWKGCVSNSVSSHVFGCLLGKDSQLLGSGGWNNADGSIMLMRVESKAVPFFGWFDRKPLKIGSADLIASCVEG